MATKLMKVGQYIYDEPASYEDFSGGINTDSSNENLLKNQLRDALNMRYDNLGLRKRFGATKHADIVFSKDLTNIQGIFLFTQVNPWLIIAANGRLYYGLYNAGGTIDLNELPIKSKIELANPNSINTAYQLYNLPIKTTELGTEIHDGYFYKPQVYSDGELIFQNKRNIEGVPHRDKFYIATGTRIVEVLIENEKPAAYLIDPYKPNGIELTQIGPNFLSPFPTLALNHRAESVKTAIHGVIPIGMNDGSVKLQAIMSYEQGKSAKDYRFKWEKIVDNDAIPVKYNDTYNLIFKSELDTKGIPISQGKDSIIITADEAQSFYYRVTFAREFERVDETVETSALKLETIAIPNGSYQDYIINQLIDWFGSATSILYTDELKQPSLEWAKINSCVKVTGDGNKLLFYDDDYNSGNWYKTIIDNPRYITNRGGLNFKTTLNEQLIKVIDFKGIIVCFSYNPYLGGNISIVMGDGDDYNDGSGQFSPYARRVVNKQISTDNPSTVHIAENIIIFKYKDMVYMIEGSQLSNEIVSVQSINDHVRTPSAYVNIPWEDNNCIAELTEDHYALIWKEKTNFVDGQMIVERPAQRIKMYYKLAFQHGGRIIFPWLRDEGTTFNVDHIIQIGNRSYHLYDNLLIGYHEKKFTDLGEKYSVRLFLRGYDLNYSQYIKMLHKLSLYYSRGDKTDIDIKVNAYNEANYKILKDPTVTHTQQNLAVQYYDDATGYKKVDNTLLDVKLFTASRRFPALFAHVTIEVENDDDFAFMSIGFIYKTRDLPKTTLFEYYKNIWTDIETPMTIMEDYKPLTVGTQPQLNNQPNVDMSYYIQLFDSFKRDFIGRAEILQLFQMSRDFIEYDNEDEFPFVGEPGKIYLARYKNTALEGQEPVIEPYNMMFRYSTSDQVYIPLAGGGTGGGGTTSSVRLIPRDGQVMTYTAALGTNTLLKYTYINADYTTATRIIYVNDIPKQTSNILTGNGEVNVTNYLQQGLNTIRIYVSDPEGRASQLTFRITMDTILLTSSYNDANVTVNAGIVIPYTVNGNATVREMHFIVDGEETIEIAYGTSNMKSFTNLTHGSHILEMYCNGIFKDVDGNTLYEIESNRLRFTMIYDDNVSDDIIIATKFNLTSVNRGIAFDVDYVVYSPILETVPVDLKINGEIVSSLVINASRRYWSIKTLNAGNHILTIETSTTVLNIPITINPVDLPVEIVQDDFLKLYMSAFGRNNADINKEIWNNIHGENVDVEFNNINYASTGWLNDALRLIGDANAIIGFKPFATTIPASGRTIELDFTTRNTLQEGVVLLECLNNDIGFVITPQVVQLKGSNTYVETKFKEDEHVKIGFTITPGENIIITYINGVISGLAFYSENTTFRQLDPQNIYLNQGGGSIDFNSIRVYDRALTAKEMLGNYIAEIADFEELIATYDFNDIYDEYGNPSKTKMGKLIPIMMFDAPIMPQFKGDKRPVKVTFEHPYEPEKNFVRNADKTVIDWQGTSSIQYPVKNYKITMNKSEKYSIEPGWIPERKFTLKADYMDSSHTHNTGLARLFDTMYAYRLPPGINNPLIRSTVYGYPIALFYRASESAPYEYKGVYNFNLDKDCTDTFGLDNEGDFPNCQSFEVSYNADSGAGAFADNTLENVIASFEARYPELDEDVFDYDTLMIYDLPAVTAHFANLRAMIQWVMDNNNLPTFKENFDLHFDREYTFKYLIATLVFGLVDNLGKNMMINTWDGQIWYPNFYDIDTAIGLENQGRNVHDYDIEIGDLGAYATSNSYLWANILSQFNIELREVYRNLRGDIFSYENILQFLKENQIDKISQSQYNLDAYAKYIGVTTSWLWMAQGTSEEHMKRWLTLRLAFLDSKYVGGEFAEYIAIRINVANGYLDTTMTITPVITQYCTIKWTDTPDVQVKTKAYEQAVITGPSVLGTGALTNIEVSIYGAKFLSDIGDLSTVYPSSISTEFAQRLRRLKIGSQVEGYNNPYLEKISIGSNTYLEEVDLTNCSNLGSVSGGTQILDLSGAENLKRLFAGNTKLIGVSFARGAALNEFVLPATLRELIMINMIFLDPEKMIFEGINNIQTLRLENIPALNPIEFFNMCPAVVYVRLTGITMSIYGLTAIENMIEKIWDHDLYIERLNQGVPNPNGYLYLGIEDSGQTRDEPVIEGIVKVLTNTIPSTQLLNDIALILPDINEQMEIVVVQDGFTFGMIGSNYGITAYAGNATVLQIPQKNHLTLSSVNDMVPNLENWIEVKEIGLQAIKDNSTITEIIVGNNITKIGERAFLNLSALTRIQLPTTLQSIERYTFDTLPLLAGIDIPASVSIIKEYAFKDLVGLSVITIPSTILTIEANAFYNTPNVTIFAEHDSKPEGWDDLWYSEQNITIIWGVSATPKTIIFDTQGGNVMQSYEGVVIMSAPTAPSKFGYDFVKWQVNGQDITFPYIIPDELTEVTLTAVWSLWVYTVNHYKPLTASTWEIHDTYQIPFGQALGQDFLDVIDPTYTGSVFSGKWMLDSVSGIQVNENYVPNQDAIANGYEIKLYSVFYNTNGLVFTYDAPNDRYNVTNYTGITNNVSLYFPDEWDDGVNGLKPVYSILVNPLGASPNSTNMARIRNVTIAPGIKKIADHGFRGCIDLFVFFEGQSQLEVIGQYAFYNANRGFVIPASVQTIGYYAFSGWNSIYAEAPFKPAGWNTRFTTTQNANAVHEYGIIESGMAGQLRYAVTSEGKAHLLTAVANPAKDLNFNPHIPKYVGSNNYPVTRLNHNLFLNIFQHENNQVDKSSTYIRIPNTVEEVINIADENDSINRPYYRSIIFEEGSVCTKWVISGIVSAPFYSEIPLSVTSLQSATQQADAPYYFLAQALSKPASGWTINSGGQALYYGTQGIIEGPELTYVYSSILDGIIILDVNKDYVLPTTYSIPSIIDGKIVKAIAPAAFWGRRIVNLTIPYTVEIIHAYAFFYNPSLRTLTFETNEGVSNLRTIEKQAFGFPTSSYFGGYSILTNLILPEGLETIGHNAFYKIAIANLSLPKTLIIMGDYAFYANNLENTNLTIAQPSELRSIGAYALYNRQFQTLDVPKVTGIGQYALYLNKILTTVRGRYIANSSMTGHPGISIGIGTGSDPAYYTCASVPLTSGSSNSWRIQTSLTDIEITDGQTDLAFSSFYNMSGLRNLILPATLTSIQSNAMYGLTGLLTLKIRATVPPINVVFTNLNPACVIKVPTGTLAAYQAAAGWSAVASQMIEED